MTTRNAKCVGKKSIDDKRIAVKTFTGLAVVVDRLESDRIVGGIFFSIQSLLPDQYLRIVCAREKVLKPRRYVTARFARQQQVSLMRRCLWRRRSGRGKKKKQKQTNKQIRTKKRIHILRRTGVRLSQA